MHKRASGWWAAVIIWMVAGPCLLGVTSRCAVALEVIPPAPPKHFNDDAGVVSADAAQRFDQQLDQFERDSSNQMVVAIYPKMQSDSDVADYTFRVKEKWRVGQKALNNGVVLFVFRDDHKLFIQVGYGLEGALPDATCKEIIDQKLTPRFKANDYEGGLREGIDAILAAAKGEYKGTGTTAAEHSPHGFHISLFWWIVIVIGFFHVLAWILAMLHRNGGTFYERHRRPLTFLEKVSLFFSNISIGSSSGGGFSSGGGSSGGGSGGGGFSGGGGSGGGGGAGGSW